MRVLMIILRILVLEAGSLFGIVTNIFQRELIDLKINKINRYFWLL